MTRLFPGLFVFALLASPATGQGPEDLPDRARVSMASWRRSGPLTTITVAYDRPIARGRALYGNLVEWDVVSTPGANRATWIEFSTPVTVEGRALGGYGPVAHSA